MNTGEITPNLRMLCTTWWTVRHGSIGSILQNYSILQNALDEIKLGHDEYAAKGNGMAIRMENFDTFCGLKLSYRSLHQSNCQSASPEYYSSGSCLWGKAIGIPFKIT